MKPRIEVISLLFCASLLAGSMVAQASPLIVLPPLRTDLTTAGVEQESMQQGYEALRAAQPDKAEKAFREANRLNPMVPEPLLGLALAAQRLGKTALALQAYESAALLAPADPLPVAMRGQYLEQLKRPADAEMAYRDALRIKPDHAGVMNNLAFLLASQKRQLDEALGLAQAAVQASPGHGNYVDTLGVVQLARGDVKAARQSFEKALLLAPGNAGFAQRLAQTTASAAATLAAPPAAVPTATLKAASAVVAATPAVAAAVVSQPKAAKPMPVSVPFDAAKVVGPAVEAWRQAWQAKDVPRYLALYAKDFVPENGKSRAAWEADRRAKLGKMGAIQVTLAQLAFSSAGETVVVNFEQKYQSSNYSDSTRKQLEWVREGDAWRIRRELQR